MARNRTPTLGFYRRFVHAVTVGPFFAGLLALRRLSRGNEREAA